MAETRARLFVAGVGLRGSGYPNACNTLRMLRDTRQIEVVECGSWLPEDTHLWKLAQSPRHKALPFLIRLLAANVVSVIRLALKNSSRDIAYVPYPGVFLLWLLSWVPRRWRPRCVCDAYITIWDSLYQDRSLGTAGSRSSRLLLWMEARALSAAEGVIVDTVANADHIHRLFGVARESIHAFPLALDATTLPVANPDHAASREIRVLFIGTFVPLQGTAVIAQAIEALRGQDNLEFVMIGDGQQAEEVAPLLEANPAVTWYRGWQPSHVLTRELALADICLGVFGGNGKAARVLPFKLYMALAAGKAIITQHEHGVPEDCPPIPALTCDACPQSLADAIRRLANDAGQRASLARHAMDYFEQQLSTDKLAQRWAALIAEMER